MIEELDELLVSHLELIEAVGIIKELVHGAIVVVKKLRNGIALVTEAGPKSILPIQSVAHLQIFFQKC